MAKHFKDFCINEKIFIDNIAADNTILSMIKQLQRENKSDQVIKLYLTSLGVSFEDIVKAFAQLNAINQIAKDCK